MICWPWLFIGGVFGSLGTIIVFSFLAQVALLRGWIELKW